MFTDLGAGERASVTISFDGTELTVPAGLNVAAALLAAGVVETRSTPKTGAARAPYCMMGICFDCLMVIDGEANRQACMVPVADGMRVETQAGAPLISLPASPATTPDTAP